MQNENQTSNEDLKKLFEEHNENLNIRLDALEKKFKPILDLYANANTFGSWIKKFLIFVALILGIALTYHQIKQ